MGIDLARLAYTPLIPALISELIPRNPERQKAAWSIATSAFALGQAGAAYGASFLFDRAGGYTSLLWSPQPPFCLRW